MKALRPVAVEALIYLAAAALWLAPAWPHPDGFLFYRGASYSDLAITHWPNAEFLLRAIRTWHQIPLWNPSILSGAPFAADPLSSLFYPPHWLALLVPVSLAFNVLFWLHLAWAGLGTCRLLRAEGLNEGPAIVGGLVFSGAPNLIGHIGSGHLTLIYAIAWMPWLMLAVQRAFESRHPGGLALVRESALAGFLLGLIFLADPRWVIPAGAITAAYAVRMYMGVEARSRLSVRALLAVVGVGIVFAAAIGAALALPLAEYVPLTTRAGLSASEASTLSMPAAHMLGYFIPSLGGTPEWIAYVGVGTLLLGFLALIARPKSSLFWLGVAVVAVVLALGDNMPLLSAIVHAVPGMGWLRVPARWLVVSAFALSVLAGIGADVLLRGHTEPLPLGRLRLGIVGLGGLVFCVGAGTSILAARAGNETLRAGGVLVLIASAGMGTWLMLGLSRRVTPRTVAAGLVLGLVAELSLVNRSALELRSAQSVLSEQAQVAGELLTAGQGSRVFSPSYSLPQQTAALSRIELADGVSPLQLRSYWESMARATGFSEAGYSVTLPPFVNGDPQWDWGAQLDLESLGRWNVGLLVSDYPLVAPGLQPLATAGEAFLYRNPDVRPRAWIETSEGAWRPVADESWSPNAIGLVATGPGQLVLSENSYPGWQATIDGVPAAETSTADGMRSVVLPAGVHQVLFVFRPASVYAGVTVTLLALLALASLWIRR